MKAGNVLTNCWMIYIQSKEQSVLDIWVQEIGIDNACVINESQQ